MCTTHSLVLDMCAAPLYPTVHGTMCKRVIKLKAQTATNSSGDLEEYRKARHALQRAVNTAREKCRDRMELIYKGSNVWLGLRTTDYRLPKKILSDFFLIFTR